MYRMDIENENFRKSTTGRYAPREANVPAQGYAVPSPALTVSPISWQMPSLPWIESWTGNPAEFLFPAYLHAHGPLCRVVRGISRHAGGQSGQCAHPDSGQTDWSAPGLPGGSSRLPRRGPQAAGPPLFGSIGLIPERSLRWLTCLPGEGALRNRRATRVPRGALLVGVRHLQQESISEGLASELEPNR